VLSIRKLKSVIVAAVFAGAAYSQISPTNVTLDGPFQIRYASNLNIGDSVVNISNTGARGASLPSGTSASITGALCANVYTFSPDEQLISCCSCPVTPNGLVSLSVKSDLTSNTLTPAVPTAVVIKLLFTAPVGGSCATSSQAPGPLASGGIGWGTSLHAFTNTTPVTYYGSETPFLPASLSAGELNRLTQGCFFINAMGSGFGICRSCRLGGLGATSR
jgi:hypothetical protein